MKYFYWARAGEKRTDGGAIIVASKASTAQERYRKYTGTDPFDIVCLGRCVIVDFPKFTKCLKYSLKVDDE